METLLKTNAKFVKARARRIKSDANKLQEKKPNHGQYVVIGMKALIHFHNHFVQNALQSDVSCWTHVFNLELKSV